MAWREGCRTNTRAAKQVRCDDSAVGLCLKLVGVFCNCVISAIGLEGRGIKAVPRLLHTMCLNLSSQHPGIDVASIKNKGVEEREARDRAQQQRSVGSGPERLAESAAALQRKAALYDRLAAQGGGDEDENGDDRYEVRCELVGRMEGRRLSCMSRRECAKVCQGT